MNHDGGAGRRRPGWAVPSIPCTTPAARSAGPAGGTARSTGRATGCGLLHTSRGTLELARGRATDALAAYRTA